MANKILLKRSSTANSVPLAVNLDYGELAINYQDGNLFFLNSSNVVTVIASTKSISLSGNITGGNILTGGLISATGSVTGSSLVGNVYANAQVIINATGQTEGGQLVFAWANIGGFTGQANATWNLDVDSSNVFRVFYQNAVGSSSVLIQASPTGNVVTFPSTAGISAVGNVTGNYFIGNGSQLTGIVAAAGASITNGTSNLVVQASSNIVANIAGAWSGQFTSVGLQANSIWANNNGQGTNFRVGDDIWIGDINLADTMSLRGQQNAANAYIVFGNADGTQLGRAGSGPLTYGGSFSVTGNVTGGNTLLSGLVVTGTTSVNGNVTLGTNLAVTGNANIGNIGTSGLLTVTSNITGGNILTGGLISATSTVTSAANITGGNLLTGGLVSSTGTITSAANVIGGNLTTAGQTSATGNITGGNILTGGLISATGNITGGNLIALTAVKTPNISIDSNSIDANLDLEITTTAGNTISIYNGNLQEVEINTANIRLITKNVSTYNFVFDNAGNLTLPTGYLVTPGAITSSNTTISTSTGTGAVTISGGLGVAGNVYAGGFYTAGLLSVTGNINGGNLNSAALITGTAASVTGNITGANLIISGFANVTGNIVGGNIQFNSGSVSGTGNITGGNLIATGVSISTLTASGNVTGGNILTSGIVSATGNVTGGNIATSGLATITGNITGGNLLTAGLVSGLTAQFTSNISGGNLLTVGLASVTGNITGGNILTAGQISATGNVTGNYILGNGSQLTGISLSTDSIFNGQSNVKIAAANANITMDVNSSSNVVLVTSAALQATLLGTYKVITQTGTLAANTNGIWIGNTSITGNVVIPSSSTVYVWTPS